MIEAQDVGFGHVYLVYFQTTLIIIVAITRKLALGRIEIAQ
jgi:hypothetical protein